jgi:hypothetical protein
VTDFGRGGFSRLANPDAELFRVLDGPRGGDGAPERLALLLASRGEGELRSESPRSHEVRPGRLLAPQRVTRPGVGAPCSSQILPPAGVPVFRAWAR